MFGLQVVPYGFSQTHSGGSLVNLDEGRLGRYLQPLSLRTMLRAWRCTSPTEPTCNIERLIGPRGTPEQRDGSVVGCPVQGARAALLWEARGVKWLIAVLACVAIGAACGGGGGSDSSDTVAPTTTAAPKTTFAPSPTVAPIVPKVRTTPSPSTTPKESVGERNAREKAADYLDYSAYSRSGLIDQLEYEGFTTAQAEYGVDAVGY